jgi:hypothetical protein
MISGIVERENGGERERESEREREREREREHRPFLARAILLCDCYSMIFSPA